MATLSTCIKDFRSEYAAFSNYLVDGFSPALEFLMLALRTADGVVSEAFEARFGVPFAPYARRLRFFEPHGLTRFESGRWRLTEQGFLLSNSILTDVLSAE